MVISNKPQGVSSMMLTALQQRRYGIDLIARARLTASIGSQLGTIARHVPHFEGAMECHVLSEDSPVAVKAAP
jgi:hypothetical protein